MALSGILRTSALCMSGMMVCACGILHADPIFTFPEEEFDLNPLLDDIPESIDSESSLRELSAIPVLGNSAAIVSRGDSLEMPNDSEEFTLLQPFGDLVLEQQPGMAVFQTAIPFKVAFRGGLRYQPGDGLSDGSSYYSRMRLTGRNGVTGTFIIERDPGEQRALDLASGSVSYTVGGLRLTAGDYRPGFGQGLVFARYGRSYVSGIDTMQRDAAVLANTSFEESGYLRGMHAELRQSRWFAQAWVSSRRKDATLDADGHAVTIRETGLHPEGSNRDNLRERLGGARFGIFPAEGIELAVAGVVSEYSPQLAGGDKEADIFDPEGAVFRHLAVSGQIERGIVRMFAEAATLSFEHEAMIGGITLKSRPISASVLVRRYDAGYWAPHAGAYSSFSGAGNEEGAYMALEAGLPGGFSGMAALDIARTLNRTYLSSVPVSRRRVQFAAGKRFAGGVTARFAVRSTVNGNETYDDRSSASLRVEHRPARSGTGWRALAAHSAGSGDSGEYLEAGMIFRGSLVEYEIGAGVFDIPSYAARYYRYERDVPGRGMSRPVWGRGGVVQVLARVREFSVRAVWRDSEQMGLSRDVTVQYDAVFHGR